MTEPPAAGRQAPPPVCSAKKCRQPAVWGLRWNNPKLHAPERRKVWTACAEHRESLESFLRLRGFLRDTVPVADLGPAEPLATPPTGEPGSGDRSPGVPGRGVGGTG